MPMAKSKRMDKGKKKNKAAVALAKEKWAKIPPEDRRELSRKMNEARWRGTKKKDV